jgi:hypothetical protein
VDTLTLWSMYDLLADLVPFTSERNTGSNRRQLTATNEVPPCSEFAGPRRRTLVHRVDGEIRCSGM